MRRDRTPRFERYSERWHCGGLARQIVEPLRQYGVFAPELTLEFAPEPGDEVEAELLCYLGRDPRWTATAAE